MADIRISHSNYDLKRPDLEASQGSLLKFDNLDSGETFYGCLCSWESLGDSALTKRLSSIVEGKMEEAHIKSPYLLAKTYGKSGKWQLSEEGMPSHILYDLGSEDSLGAYKEGGFSRIKLKIHSELSLSLLDLFFELEQFPEKTYLNLDFNLKFSKAQVFKAIEKLSEEQRRKILWIEDAFSGSLEEWKYFESLYGIKILSDWFKPEGFNKEDISGMVFKPSKDFTGEPLSPLAEGKTLLVTSYLSHPLEQYLCQSYANDLLSKDQVYAGTCSHYSYPVNPYSRKFKVVDSVLSLQEGNNWQDLLDQEDWRELGVFEEAKILGG